MASGSPATSPHAHLETVSGAKHFMPEDHPREVAARPFAGSLSAEPETPAPTAHSAEALGAKALQHRRHDARLRRRAECPKGADEPQQGSQHRTALFAGVSVALEPESLGPLELAVDVVGDARPRPAVLAPVGDSLP